MGNRPSHRPFEGSPDTDGSDPDGSTVSRVAGALRGVLRGLYRRVAGGDEGTGETGVPAVPSDTPDRREERMAVAGETTLPRRDRPFTRPTRDEATRDPPDLRARTEDGRISIYYPDHDGAEITSDTWERVDR